MAQMTHEYSQFPNKVMELHHYKDVDDSIAPLVNQIKKLQQQNLFNQSQRIVEQNKDVLGSYILDSGAINSIGEEVRNLEIYALQVQQSIHYTPEDGELEQGIASKGDVWIGS